MAAVNPRLDEFERDNIGAELIDLEEFFGTGRTQDDFYRNPLRESLTY